MPIQNASSRLEGSANNLVGYLKDCAEKASTSTCDLTQVISESLNFSEAYNLCYEDRSCDAANRKYDEMVSFINGLKKPNRGALKGILDYFIINYPHPHSEQLHYGGRRFFTIPVTSREAEVDKIYAMEVSETAFLNIDGPYTTCSGSGTFDMPDTGITGIVAWNSEHRNGWNTKPCETVTQGNIDTGYADRLTEYASSFNGDVGWEDMLLGRAHRAVDCYTFALHTKLEIEKVTAVLGFSALFYNAKIENAPFICPFRDDKEIYYELACSHPLDHVWNEYEAIDPREGARPGDRLIYLRFRSDMDMDAAKNPEFFFPFNNDFFIAHAAIVVETDEFGIPTLVMSKFGSSKGLTVGRADATRIDYGQLAVILRRREDWKPGPPLPPLPPPVAWYQSAIDFFAESSHEFHETIKRDMKGCETGSFSACFNLAGTRRR